MRAIEPDLRAGGSDMLLALKKKGYRLTFAERGLLSSEDLVLASQLGLTVLFKGHGFFDELIELPLGKGRADIYRLGRRARIPNVRPGEGALLVNLRDFSGNYSLLSRLIERHKGYRFLFTVSPSKPEDVKDPRDMLAFLVEVLKMNENRAYESITRWPP
ncbi:MAG: hypothetical protein ACP5GO_02610 [Thermoprotei archaeon]